MTEEIGAQRTLSVELYCQPSTAAVVPLDRHHRRLTELSRAGVVDALDVTTWPGHVTLPSGDDRPPEHPEDDRYEVVELFREFETWADREGVSLEPAFGRRRYESTFTDERGVSLRLPVVAMAVREDGDLQAVYPHQDHDQQTVADGVRRLTGGDTTASTGVVHSAGD